MRKKIEEDLVGSIRISFQNHLNVDMECKIRWFYKRRRHYPKVNIGPIEAVAVMPCQEIARWCKSNQTSFDFAKYVKKA
ncbi:hypothetical protein GQ457_01G034160 [Hibiscus cannabinus]